MKAETGRAETFNDFLYKIGIVEKKAAETAYWLERCEQTRTGDLVEGKALLQAANELLAIFVALGKSTRLRNTVKTNTTK